MRAWYSGVTPSQAANMQFLMKTGTPRSRFGTSLRVVRESKFLTMQQLAAACGMKWEAVRRLETSPTSNPQLATIQRLAGALGVSVAELVKDVPAIAPLPIGKEDDK
jgi:transcriptional regulator with XRE-family HTH domain